MFTLHSWKVWLLVRKSILQNSVFVHVWDQLSNQFVDSLHKLIFLDTFTCVWIYWFFLAPFVCPVIINRPMTEWSFITHEKILRNARNGIKKIPIIVRCFTQPRQGKKYNNIKFICSRVTESMNSLWSHKEKYSMNKYYLLGIGGIAFF